MTASQDMVRDVGGSSKSVRFPEKLIKRLNDRLELIAMGATRRLQGPKSASDYRHLLRHFQGTSFQKQMKENRKIEELILIFVTTAQASLKKRSVADELEAGAKQSSGPLCQHHTASVSNRKRRPQGAHGSTRGLLFKACAHRLILIRRCILLDSRLVRIEWVCGCKGVHQPRFCQC